MASSDSRALIETLVGFDTVSAKSNLALIEFLQDRLAEHGVSSRLVHDETGKKANLYATIGPGDRPGVLLGSAVQRLIRLYGVKPGRRAVVAAAR